MVPERRSSSSRSTVRRTAPPPKRIPLLLPILAGAGIVGLVIALVVAFGGRKPKPPVRPPPLAALPAEVPKPPPPPPPPAKKAAPPAAPDEKTAFEARLAARREAALKRHEKAREALDQERQEAAEIRRERAARMALKPVTLSLLSGERLAGAVILDASAHDLELRTADGPRRVPWDSLSPASLLPAADAMFDPDSGARQFDRGRFFIARRMWPEARSAFDRAAALGAEFAEKAEELRGLLERVVSAEGVGRGRARRAGPDQIRLAYDFRDDDQLRDFSPGLVRKDDAALLEADEEAELFLTGGSADDPLVFEEDLTLEMKVSADSSLTLQLFASDRGGYELEFGPGGVALARLDEAPAPPRVLARAAAPRLIPGKVHMVKLQVRLRRFRLQVDGVESLAAEDPVAAPDEPRRQGLLGLRLPKGRFRLHAPFAVQGRVRAGEIEKRIGESEVLLRRALDEDLAGIARRREEAEARDLVDQPRTHALSADDPYFAFRIRNNEDLMKYETLKKSLLEFLQGFRFGGGGREFDLTAASTELEGLLSKYPDVPALHYLRASLGCERQEHGSLRRDVARALELFPDFAEALILDSRLRLEEGDFEGARRSADRAVELRPDHAPAYVQRAIVRFSSPRRSAFLDDLDLALQLDPSDPGAASMRRILQLGARGPRELGCRFEHETEHFFVTTDISVEAARNYGALLEAAYRHFAETLREFYRPPAGPKPRVAIFNTAENYYTYFELLSEDRGEYTAGVFRRHLNELVLFESLDAEETVHTLLHESFHYFTTLLLRDTPPFWWNEGMAEYMGALEIRDGKVARKGVVLNERLRLLRFALMADRTVSFEKIMNETPREFYGPDAIIRYSQAWSMIHFLFEHDGGRHRPLLDRYLAALRARKAPREAWDEVFAPVAAVLEKDWKVFARRLKLDGEK